MQYHKGDHVREPLSLKVWTVLYDSPHESPFVCVEDGSGNTDILLKSTDMDEKEYPYKVEVK